MRLESIAGIILIVVLGYVVVNAVTSRINVCKGVTIVECIAAQDNG